MRTAVTGLPRPVAASPLPRLGRKRWRRLRRASARRPQAPPPLERTRAAAQNRWERPGGSAASRFARAPEARPRGDQQDAGHAAADGGLGQRHIRRIEPDPDDRKQEPVGDIADDRAENLARGDGPGGDRQDKDRETDDRGPGGRSLGRSPTAAARARSVARSRRRTIGRGPRWR